METAAYLRRIPKVDELLADPAFATAAGDAPRWAVMDALRGELEDVRRELLGGADDDRAGRLTDRAAIIARSAARIRRVRRWGLRRVINATGIIVHTNLGRSPLAAAAISRVVEAAAGFTNLEFDLERGSRGSRHDHLRGVLTRLTGAEDALVVNNNAAAVLLALNTLARGREAVVSRGELVEIGGSFRIPDVMARSGAVLREVGATNRTRLGDFEEAVGPQTALLLRVHTSNYRVVGFTSAVPLEELVALGRRTGVPVMDDLGSGCLVDLSPWGLGDEPLVRRSVEAGADLVTFSGDKLLGGPQAGIVVGRRDLIRLIDANPLHRAVRIDKLTAAALEATLRLYLEGEAALSAVPVLAMITTPAVELRRRGRAELRRLRGRLPAHLSLSLEDTASQVGGGSLPLQDIPSAALVLTSTALSPNGLEERLRQGEPPVIGRIAADRLLLDLRTVLPGDYPDLRNALTGLSA